MSCNAVGAIASKRKDTSLSKKQRDSYGTPRELYSWLDREYEFLGDMAASNENHLHPRVWFTEERSALTISWSDFLASLYKITIRPGVYGDNLLSVASCRKRKRKGVPYVYLNYPYSDAETWLRKVVIEWRAGLGVVVLCKNGGGEHYWQECVDGKASEMYFITGRLAHRHPVNHLPVKGSSFGSVILVYDPEIQSPPFTKTRWIEKSVFDQL